VIPVALDPAGWQCVHVVSGGCGLVPLSAGALAWHAVHARYVSSVSVHTGVFCNPPHALCAFDVNPAAATPSLYSGAVAFPATPPLPWQ
jgi:hypothetical protein